MPDTTERRPDQEPGRGSARLGGWLTDERSDPRRQNRTGRAGRAVWAAAVARRSLGPAARLVAGRATGDERVRVAVADLAASCCLSVTATATSNVLADLAGRGLLARDGGALVLTLPAGRWSP